MKQFAFAGSKGGEHSMSKNTGLGVITLINAACKQRPRELEYR